MSGTRILSLLGKITVLLVICCCCLPAQAKYGGGTGGPNDPYLIYTAGQMNEIGLSVNWGDLDKYFKLMVDIDLGGFTGTSFNIIGYFAGENSRDNKPFTGVFDGNGHTIANFTYNSNDRRSIGLFGYVSGENAEIKNLGLIDPNVDAGTGDYVGSLVGSLREGAVTGCYVQGGSVKGDNYVGGLVGTNSYHGLIINGTITNCYSTAGVSGNLYVGGLVGLNHESTITNCCSTASVAANRYVGGLVGRNCRGTITNCYSTAPVAADSYVGGLVGYNEGTITDCYAVGSVEGEYCVGGLAGQNGTTWGEGAITNCYS
ncbi:MAG: GLUG motif-containing protein, partial [Planctomycetota bacterium]